MSRKLSWYKATRTMIEVASVVYFLIGSFVFLTGLLKLLWAQTAMTSVQAGSYMGAAFVAIGTATLGFIGAFKENFCMTMAYGSIQVVSFAVRTITTMVLVKISFTKDTVVKANSRAIDEIPYMISGLPGTSSVPLELLYSVIEVSLATAAFYLAWALNRKDSLAFMDSRYYYTANGQLGGDLTYFTNANVV